MLDVSPDDIAKLDDATLRELIGRLCEAELIAAGHSASHVTYGGDQNAPDGGLDVRVSLPPDSSINGHIPRNSTGFQVKRQSMGPAQIKREMRPSGSVRKVIQDLASHGGAYIIASSVDNTSDSALSKRKAAMAEAICGVPDSNQLFLDFYDRTQIASWVRVHPSIVVWVQEKVGSPFSGWRRYGHWASSRNDEYLLDDKVRLVRSEAKEKEDASQSIASGLLSLRQILSTPRGVVRLVGLSGVGKTRLVESLFDNSVGEEALAPTLALYTNIAYDPTPKPVALAAQLVNTKVRAIVVVDNCPSDLHRLLAEACTKPGSQISLLTVEFDIREDVPESTQVFKLEPASKDLIESLVQKQFPAVSSVDAQTIAEWSGGNARVALALAGTVTTSGELTGLADNDLFRRLFQQRHELDKELYLAAQACSLVYSFDGNDQSPDGELARLGRLVDQSPKQMHHHVAELERRDLVQKRGVWRAVLPQAIAIHLAGMALQNIPYVEIEENLVADNRCFTSFTRRLGMLEKSRQASEIAEQWLAPGGRVAGAPLECYDTPDWLENIAPLAPGMALDVLESRIEQAIALGTSVAIDRYLNLIRLVAYESRYFERCTSLMVRMLAQSDLDGRPNTAEPFQMLFRRIASGTHATINQRKSVVEKLLRSHCGAERRLGVLALNEALATDGFWVTVGFEFGGKSRDYGWYPKTKVEVQEWLSAFLKLIEEFGAQSSGVMQDVRQILASRFRSVWALDGMHAELGRVAETLNSFRHWPEGWVAVREALRFGQEKLSSESCEALTRLEKILRPVTLVDQVRTFVFSEDGSYQSQDTFDSCPYTERQVAMAENRATELGRQVAANESAFAELLPEMMVNVGRLFHFGKGLGRATEDLGEVWQEFANAARSTKLELLKPLVLRGYFSELHARDATLASTILDELLEDPDIAWLYPDVQASFPLGTDDLARLARSLVTKTLPAWAYGRLCWSRAVQHMQPGVVKELTLLLRQLDGGFPIAVDFLWEQFRYGLQSGREVAAELVETGCTLLEDMPPANNDDTLDWTLGELARKCFAGSRGRSLAQRICRSLRESHHERREVASRDHFLSTLFHVQPHGALDGVFGETENEARAGQRFMQAIRWHTDFLAGVAEGELLEWCAVAPDVRYIAMAGAVCPAYQNGETGAWNWNPIALALVRNAPDPAGVLVRLVDQLLPGSGWTGEIVTELRAKLDLLDEFQDDRRLQDEVFSQKERLQQMIARQQARDAADAQDQHLSFE
jgi:hypothetical protein